MYVWYSKWNIINEKNGKCRNGNAGPNSIGLFEQSQMKRTFLDTYTDHTILN